MMMMECDYSRWARRANEPGKLRVKTLAYVALRIHVMMRLYVMYPMRGSASCCDAALPSQACANVCDVCTHREYGRCWIWSVSVCVCFSVFCCNPVRSKITSGNHHSAGAIEAFALALRRNFAAPASKRINTRIVFVLCRNPSDIAFDT